ncbi:hypothetical protein ABZ619_33785 [Streptomyces sp. NPDC007851]|uniref:hypothetical protein n=1 Tax=Streptomyces sp. NPDC007851 TaxID=3155008 RepID=UPI0033E72D70
MDERTPTSPAAPGDAVPVAAQRAAERAAAASQTRTPWRARSAPAPSDGVQGPVGTRERQRADRSRRTPVAGALVLAVASGMAGGLIVRTRAHRPGTG